ncbi:MAG: alpha/beta fold hydrolase [Propionibacteriaceae bacterium]|nr:alpha/beta fold hydrolase [Propionibacteriaceae bacterium]
MAAGLSFEVVGDGRPDFAFLHGLFGRGRNWTQVAKGLAAQGWTSVLFDLPNHGSSPWTQHFSYPEAAGAVAAEIEARLGHDARITLAGHSLGGKVAMLTALAHPDLVASLAVIDIAPTRSAQVSGFAAYFAAMDALDLGSLTSRGQADRELTARIPDRAVRGFLLTNLRPDGGWHWQPNLRLLEDELDAISEWPDPGEVSYSGPTSWIVGERSPYYDPGDLARLRRLFPAVETVVVPDAGHWVHADNPSAVVAALAELRRRQS